MTHIPTYRFQIDPRESFSRVEITYFNTLLGSVQRDGVRNPLIIGKTPLNRGQYEVVDGKLRLLVSRLLGIPTVPCVFREVVQLPILPSNLIKGSNSPHLMDLSGGEGSQTIQVLPIRKGIHCDELKLVSELLPSHDVFNSNMNPFNQPVL